MKRIGNIMSEMGFNKDAPESTKKAFLKHLFKAAEADHEVAAPQIVATPVKSNVVVHEKNNSAKKIINSTHNEQLEFDLQPALFDDAG